MQSTVFRGMLVVAVAYWIPNLALAWGGHGHEAVGYVAASLIKGTNAEKQVKKLLHPGESLATAAEWPDCAKGFTYCHADPTPEMKDFAARNPAHHNYHYTDIPFQFSAYERGDVGASSDDIVSVLEDAIRVLKGQAPADQAHNLTKREALFIIAHMVGDIHQPFHVGAAYVSDTDGFVVPKDPDEAKATTTQGGNFLCDKSKGVHSLWDDDYVVKAMRAAKATTNQEFAQTLLPKARKVKRSTGDVMGWPSLWATETLHEASLDIAPLTVVDRRSAGPGRSPCRAGGNGPGNVWDIQLPDQYAADGATTASDQLAKAGARLARLLQAIWP